MAFELFTSTYRTVQNPIDLNVLASTYNTLEKSHQQAVDTSAAYITALGDLPVNEAERPYIQKHINSIQETLNNEKIYGNAYAALDDIKLLGAKISTDPGIKARIKAEAAYQNYMKLLDADKTISEADKEFFRVHNKYYYQDKYDEKGNIIGGTEWTPQKRHVAAPDMVGMMAQALKIAAAEGGSSNTVYYKDANGNYTPNQNASVDKIPYYSIQGKYERLPKDRIRAALNTVIANTDGAIEGLQQDFEIAKWRHNKPDGLVVDETTDDKGLPLNFEQYLEKRFSGFYHSASYSRFYQEKLTPLAGMQMEIAKTKASKTTSNNTKKNMIDAIMASENTVKSKHYESKQNAIGEVVSGVNAVKEKMRAYADSLDVQWNPNDMKANYDNIIAANGGRPNKELYKLWDKFKIYQQRFDSIVPEGANKDAILFVENLQGGVDLSNLNGNKYADDYNKLVNKAYENGKEPIIYLKGNHYDTIKQIPNFDELGLVTKIDKNNKPYLVLPKESSNNLLRVANATKGLRQYGFGYSGKYTSVPEVNIAIPELSSSNSNSSTIFNEISNYVNDINTNEVEPVMKGGLEVPTEAVNYTDIIQKLALGYVQSGTISDFKSALEFSETQLMNTFDALSGERVDLAIGTGNNIPNYNNTSEERNAFVQLVKRARTNKDNVVSIEYNKSDLKSIINVALSPKFIEDNKDIKYYCDILGVDVNNPQLAGIADSIWGNEMVTALHQDPVWDSNQDFIHSNLAGVTHFDLGGGDTLDRIGENEFILTSEGVPSLLDFYAAQEAYASRIPLMDYGYQVVEDNYNGYKYNETDIMKLTQLIANNIYPQRYPNIPIDSPDGQARLVRLVKNILNTKLD